VDGVVKIWDLRRSSGPLHSWTMQEGLGLSAFDLHDQAAVFATSSAVSSKEWRSQTVLVHPLKQDSEWLGRFTMPTGLGHPPRLPSPFHTTSSSLSFHPTEMLLGAGGNDGKVTIIGCNLTDWRSPELDDEQNGFPGNRDYFMGSGVVDQAV